MPEAYYSDSQRRFIRSRLYGYTDSEGHPIPTDAEVTAAAKYGIEYCIPEWCKVWYENRRQDLVKK